MIMTKRYELVWIGGTESEMQESANGGWVKDEDYDALQSLNAELLEALQWMVENDDTNEGDEPLDHLGGATWNEFNAYWIEGLNKARAAIAKARSQA
jgi:hypothetical protein